MLPIQDKLLKRLAAGVKPAATLNTDQPFTLYCAQAMNTQPAPPIDMPASLRYDITTEVQQAIQEVVDEATTRAAKDVLVITPTHTLHIDTITRTITRSITNDSPTFLDHVDAVATITEDGHWESSPPQPGDNAQLGTPRAGLLPGLGSPPNPTMLKQLDHSQSTQPAEAGSKPGKDAQ